MPTSAVVNIVCVRCTSSEDVQLNDVVFGSEICSFILQVATECLTEIVLPSMPKIGTLSIDFFSLLQLQ